MSQNLFKDPIVVTGPTLTGDGNGTLSIDRLTHFTTPQTYTITCIARSPSTIFSVVGSLDGSVGVATVGTQFFDEDLKIFFTIQQGSTVFEVGDQFVVEVENGTDLDQDNIDDYDELPQKNFGEGVKGSLSGDHNLRYLSSSVAANLYLQALKWTAATAGPNGNNVQIQYYAAIAPTFATLSVTGLTYMAVAPGPSSVTIEYENSTTAGSEVASVVGNAIKVTIQGGVTTASQVAAAINASAPALALVSVAITSGSTTQPPMAPTSLTGGTTGTGYSAPEVQVVGSLIKIYFRSGVHTTTAIKAAADAESAATALATSEIIGVGADTQTSPDGPYSLSGGRTKFYAFNVAELTDPGNFFEGNASLLLEQIKVQGKSTFEENVDIKAPLTLRDPNSGPYVANAQKRFDELQDGIDEVAADLADHLSDTSNAHAASSIGFTPAGSISSTNTQAAVEEVANDAATALAALAATTVDRVRVVAKNGNDSTGTGSWLKPYLTIGAALASITDATTSKHYVVIVMPGEYVELNSFAFKPNVSVFAHIIGSVTITKPDGLAPALNTIGVASSTIFRGIGTQGLAFTNAGSGTTGVIQLYDCISLGANSFTFNGNGTDEAGILTYVGIVNSSGPALELHGVDFFAKDPFYTTYTIDSTGGTNTYPNAYGTFGTLAILLGGAVRSTIEAGSFSVSGSTFLSLTGFKMESQLTASGAGVYVRADVSSFPSAETDLVTGGGAVVERTTNAYGLKYQPTTPGNWTSFAVSAPSKVDDALDALAAALAGGSIGGGGGVNYYSANANAETDTSGYTTYADGSATPVDGTGGSPTGTWTRSTSSPLRGTASFLWTPGALGNGVAFTITPERADIKHGAMMHGSFDYEPGATIAEGDYVVYVYDVANSALIQPVGHKLPSGVSGASYKHAFSFQLPVNGTTFRVLLHQAVASPGSLKVDNWAVGPKEVGSNGSVTGRTSTSTAQSIASGSDVGLSYDAVDFDSHGGFSTAGGITRYTARESGKYRISAAASLASTSAVGHVHLQASKNGAALTVSPHLQTNGASENWGVALSDVVDLDAGDYVEIYLNHNLGAGITIRASAPYQNYFAVDMVASVDVGSDGRVVAARQSGSSTSMSTGVGTDVAWTSTAFDSHGALSSSTYVVPVAGYYRVTAKLQWASASWTNGAGSLGQASLYKNGVLESILGEHYITSTGITGMGVCGSTVIKCVAGDVLKIQGAQNSGGTIALTGSADANFWTVERLTGPSSVMPGETVAAKFSTNAGNSIADGTTTFIDFEDKSFDTHNSVTGAGGGNTTTAGTGWKFVAPAPGKYRVSAQATFAAFSAVSTLVLFLYKNASAETGINVVTHATSAEWAAQATDVFQLEAGDTIQVAVQQNTGGSQNLLVSGGRTLVTIERLG